MKSTRFYKLVIAILLLVNLSMLTFIWLGGPPHPPRPGDEPKLANDLGLTGEHKAQVDALEIQHHEDKRALMKHDAELHQELFDLVGSGTSEEEVLAKLNANKSEIERMTFAFFNEVAAHCNEAQKKNLHQFINESIGRITGGPPRH